MSLELHNICVYIEDEAHLNQARELLSRYGHMFGDVKFHYDNKDNHIWYSKSDKKWYSATLIFEEDNMLTLTELKKLLEGNK